MKILALEKGPPDTTPEGHAAFQRQGFPNNYPKFILKQAPKNIDLTGNRTKIRPIYLH